MRRAAIIAALALVATSFAAAQGTSRSNLAIVPPERPRCMEQQPCTIELHATGGRPPLQWRVVRGGLPGGLGLDRTRGVVSGVPTRPGVFTANVMVTDSQGRSAQLSITITVVSTLEVEWESAPALNDSSVRGILHVTNHSGNEVMLTVVIVAVNEIGKAFTLGYQHFALAAGATSPSIPFGTQIQLPPGRYGARVDAVGEVAPKNIIYRSAVEAGPFLNP